MPCGSVTVSSMCGSPPPPPDRPDPPEPTADEAVGIGGSSSSRSRSGYGQGAAGPTSESSWLDPECSTCARSGLVGRTSASGFASPDRDSSTVPRPLSGASPSGRAAGSASPGPERSPTAESVIESGPVTPSEPPGDSPATCASRAPFPGSLARVDGRNACANVARSQAGTTVVDDPLDDPDFRQADCCVTPGEGSFDPASGTDGVSSPPSGSGVSAAGPTGESRAGSVAAEIADPLASEPWVREPLLSEPLLSEPLLSEPSLSEPCSAPRSPNRRSPNRWSPDRCSPNRCCPDRPGWPGCRSPTSAQAARSSAAFRRPTADPSLQYRSHCHPARAARTRTSRHPGSPRTRRPRSRAPSSHPFRKCRSPSHHRVRSSHDPRQRADHREA